MRRRGSRWPLSQSRRFVPPVPRRGSAPPAVGGVDAGCAPLHGAGVGAMNSRQLDLLLAVVESGGYTQAGTRLHISPSAIHRHIRLLEEEIGSPIFTRKGRHVALMEVGRVLLDLARQTRNNISDAERRIEDVRQLRRGHLNLGTGGSILTSFLPPLLRRFHREFPGVGVHILTGTADHVAGQLAEGNLDLGIMYNPADMPPGTRGLQHEILYREEFLWAVAKEHPLAKRKSIALSDLVQFPFAMLPRQSHIRRIFDRSFENARLEPSVVMELEGEEAIEKVIEINMSVGLLSKHRVHSSRIHFFRIPGQPVQIDVGMVYPRKEHMPRAVTEFMRLCRLRTMRK